MLPDVGSLWFCCNYLEPSEQLEWLVNYSGSVYQVLEVKKAYLILNTYCKGLLLSFAGVFFSLGV